MRECAKVKMMLSRYIDKEADKTDIVIIEAHLTNCPLCKEELSELVRIKGLVSASERKTLPREYLVSRLRDAIARGRYAEKRFSLAGMGNFARKLIPVPVAVMAASIAFLIITSAQPADKYSVEDHIFSGSAATTETALELILGSQN